jgi:hypothetical protein
MTIKINKDIRMGKNLMSPLSMIITSKLGRMKMTTKKMKM